MGHIGEDEVNDTDWSRKVFFALKTLSASKTSHKITKYIPIVNQIDNSRVPVIHQCLLI